MEYNSKTIFAYSGELLSINSIVRIEEVDEETFLFIDDNSKSKSVLSIDELEWELPKNIFIRVHPKHLINKNFSKSIITVNTQWIELENGEKIPTTKELTVDKKSYFKNHINAFKWLKSIVFKSKQSPFN